MPETACFYHTGIYIWVIIAKSHYREYEVNCTYMSHMEDFDFKSVGKNNYLRVFSQKLSGRMPSAVHYETVSAIAF